MLDNRKSFLVARISAQVSSWAISAVPNSGCFCLGTAPLPLHGATHGIGTLGRVSQILHSVSAVREQYGVLLLP